MQFRTSLSNDEYQRHDGWFGTDWHKWYDSLAVAEKSEKLYGDPAAVTYKNRWDDKSDYILGGFPFAQNGNPRSNYAERQTSGIEFALDYKAQLGQHHQIKTGIDFKQHTCRYFFIDADVMSYTDESEYGSIKNVPLSIWMSSGDVNTYGYDIYGNKSDKRRMYYEDDTTLVGIAAAPKKPIEMAIYFQDKIEYNDLIINAGLRLDYFDSDDRKLKNPGNPEVDKVSGYITDAAWEDVDPFVIISPRLGFSFPTGPTSHFYINYGKFSQMPSYSKIYYGEDEFSNDIVTGNISPIGFGLEPLHTTSYEIGFKKALSDYFVFNTTAFYKNQKGLIQTYKQEADKDAYIAGDYMILKNGDFSTNTGLELELSLRRFNRLAGKVSYTYTSAEGTASNDDTYLSAAYNNSMLPTTINPLDFSQTHVGNINMDYRFDKNEGGLLKNSGINLLFSFSSGHPYTRVWVETGGQADPEDAGVDYIDDTRPRHASEPVNSSRTPWTFTTDLRLDKSFEIGRFDLNAFVIVENLFNRRNVINVYPLTGNAEDDGFINHPDKVETHTSAYGAVYEEMYRAINIKNGVAYDNVAGELWGAPRQIHFGIKITL